MKKKSFFAVFLVCALSILTTVTVFADDEIDNRIADLESQISELQDELSQLKTLKRQNTVIENNSSNINLYDNDLKIDLTGIGADSGISLYIENNSSLNLGIMARAVAINGYMIGENSYGFNSFDVASGRKTNAIEEIDKSILDKYDISSFDTIDVLFWAYDNDKSFKSFDTGQIHVALNEGSENNLDIVGETLYENNGINVDFIESSGDAYTYCLTNTSGNYIDFSVENMTVNGFTSSDVDYDLYDVLVLNNCQILFDIIPEDDFLSLNGISDIYSLEFCLNIKPLSDYSGEWNTEMITKNF